MRKSDIFQSQQIYRQNTLNLETQVMEGSAEIAMLEIALVDKPTSTLCHKAPGAKHFSLGVAV